MCEFSLSGLVAVVVQKGEKALKSRLHYFCIQMDLISWKPLEIPKLILVENICKCTHPLVPGTAVMKDAAGGAGQCQQGCAIVSPHPAACSRSTLALVVLETSFWS